MNNPGDKIINIAGRGFHLPGHSINTDIIIPAGFLTRVTFDELGPSVFANDRAARREKGEIHPFDAPGNQGAKVLVVDGDFGSGSSREHAPQAIARWGIQCIVGISFAEIFAGNSTAIGLPCVRVKPEHHATLVAAMAANPCEFEVNLAEKTVTYRPAEQIPCTQVPLEMPDGDRAALTEGRWDNLPTLLEAGDLIEKTERRQPSIPVPRFATAA